jgi:hypothetical protein
MSWPALVYPESQAVERWGDGETYGCCLVQLGVDVPPSPWIKNVWYCGYVRFKVAPITDTRTCGGVLDRVDCHGGVTYAAIGSDGSGVYGFDCNHSFDRNDPDTEDMEWLKAEVERMRESILDLAVFITGAKAI